MGDTLVKRPLHEKGEGACPNCDPQTKQLCSTGQGIWDAKECAGNAYENSCYDADGYAIRPPTSACRGNWIDYQGAINRYNRHVYGKEVTR